MRGFLFSSGVSPCLLKTTGALEMVPGELFESGSRRFAYSERPLRTGGTEGLDIAIIEK